MTRFAWKESNVEWVRLMITTDWWFRTHHAKPLRNSLHLTLTAPAYMSRQTVWNIELFPFERLFSRIKKSKKMEEYHWTCNICSAIFYSSKSVWIHYNSEHVQCKYICAICSDEFREKSSFKVHWDHEHQRSNGTNVNTYFERKIELVRSNHEFSLHSLWLFA